METGNQPSSLKMGLLTCMWQRHALTNLIFSYYKELADTLKDSNITLELVSAGSEGEVSRNICENNGFHYIEYENSPLGAKWNSGLKIMETLDVDAVIIIGSDDILNKEAFYFYKEAIKGGAKYISFTEFYLMDLPTRRIFLWSGYNDGRENKTIGLGRVIHREYLDKLGWKLWDDHLESGLDASMASRLSRQQFFLNDQKSHINLKCKDSLFVPMDIKTDKNMWSYDQMVKTAVPHDAKLSILTKYFPDDFVNDLLNLDCQDQEDQAPQSVGNPNRIANEKMGRLIALENSTRKALATKELNGLLYRDVVNFLKFDGESGILSDWLINWHMSHGSIKEPSSANIVVSVIIPCFNYGEYLQECVESVLMQTFTEHEIIIINDGSTDNTHEVAQEILKDYPEQNIRYYKQQNMGIVQPRNRGVTLAKGEFILPIDADDFISPDFLAKTVPPLQSNPNLAYISTKTLFFCDKNSIWPKADFNPTQLLITNQQTNTTLYRKEMWKDIGGYDETMVNGFMDWEFWIKATEKGWFGAQIDEPLFFYRRKRLSVVTKAKEREAMIKRQIVKLHPGIYDAAMLKECGEEINCANWIPPKLVRPDLKIIPRHAAPRTGNNNCSNAEQDINNQIKNTKKHIRGILAQIVPQSKEQFLRNEAGSGDENKFEQLYKQISSRIAKFNKTGNFDEAVNVGAILLSLYPIEKTAVLLFMDSLLKKGDLAAAYSIGSFYLSVWLWDKKILRTLSNILCLQADSDGQSDKTMGFLEGAILLSPDSRLALTKTFEFQISNGLLSAAERTRTLAEIHGIKLPAVPLKDDDKSSRKKRKHIWYVTNAFGYIGGGVNGVSQAKFATLGSLLHNNDICKVSVITPLTTELPAGIAEFANHYPEIREKENAEWPDWITTIKKKPKNHLGALEQDHMTGEWLPCRIPQGKPDLIILEGVRRTPYDYYKELGLKFDCPTAYMHHASPDQYSDSFTDSRNLHLMMKSLIEIDYHISVSKNVAEEWLTIPETAEKKWFNIHNCVREDEINKISKQSREEVRTKLQIPQGDFILACLASVQHRKGQDILLNQIDSILQEVPNARVLFIGPIIEEWGGKEILKLSQNKQYSDKVHFIGAKINALDYVYASDLLVLPSREEALPLSILEAMALGRTCVASDVYGIPELIEDGETGLMFSLDNPQDLAKHIIRLAQNPEELETMSMKAEARYWENFSREQHARRWREVLMEMFGINNV